MEAYKIKVRRQGGREINTGYHHGGNWNSWKPKIKKLENFKSKKIGNIWNVDCFWKTKVKFIINL